MYREWPIEKECGFSIRIENVTGKKVYFVIKDQEGNKTVYQIGTTPISKFVGKTWHLQQKSCCILPCPRCCSNGKKCIERLRTPKQKDGMYETWVKENKVTRQELNRQRKRVLKRTSNSALLFRCIRRMNIC